MSAGSIHPDANPERSAMLEASPSTSSSLIERVKARDPQAWDRLCQIYGPLVYRWARQAGLQDQDAADVGQEVFGTVAARVSAFDHARPGGTFRGWLWTITRNKLGDHFRRCASRPAAAGGTDAHERLQQLAEIPPEGPSTSADFDPQASLLHRTLSLIRAEFEEKTWQAFYRATIEGHAAADIAADLGMTLQAVRQAKYRVLRRLRSEMDPAEGA